MDGDSQVNPATECKLRIETENPAKSVAAKMNDDEEPVAEESDEEAAKRAFISVAGGKSYVSLKDLLNWDFVLLLVAEVTTHSIRLCPYILNLHGICRLL